MVDCAAIYVEIPVCDFVESTVAANRDHSIDAGDERLPCNIRRFAGVSGNVFANLQVRQSSCQACPPSQGSSARRRRIYYEQDLLQAFVSVRLLIERVTA